MAGWGLFYRPDKTPVRGLPYGHSGNRPRKLPRSGKKDGVVGGVGNTVGSAASGAASTVPRTTQDAGATANSTAGAAANTTARAEGGLTPAGDLKPTSRGIYGLNGLSLNANAANTTEGSLIIAAGKNVHLDSGTRMLLVAQAGLSSSVEKR